MIRALRSHFVPFVALLSLLALTAASAFLPLGGFNIVVALTIAVAKAGVVFYLFMGLKRENALVRIVSGAGIVWLAIMLTLAVVDFLSRFPGKLAE